MERYIGLDPHGTSCTFGVLGPSGRKLRHDVVETNVHPWPGRRAELWPALEGEDSAFFLQSDVIGGETEWSYPEFPAAAFHGLDHFTLAWCMRVYRSNASVISLAGRASR